MGICGASGVHAGDDYRFSGGQAIDGIAWYGDNAATACQAVGGKLPNQLGLHDMSGNLYEFCWDRFDEVYYTACDGLGTVTDPAGGDTGVMRVEKGGGWGGASVNCRWPDGPGLPGVGVSHTGFRLVRKLTGRTRVR